MKKIWVIAWKDVVMRMRDRKGLLLLVLMPLVLTLILGAVFGGEENSMPEMKVAVFDGDQGEVSKGMVEGVLQGEGVAEFVTLLPQDAAEDVERLVQEGAADVGLVVPKGLEDSIRRGEAAQIAVWEYPGKSTRAAVVKSIVGSYVNRVSTVSMATQAVVADLAKEAMPVLGQTASPPLNADTPGAVRSQADIAQAVQSVAAELAQVAQEPGTEVVDSPVGSKAVSGQQYYAAGMAAMFLLFNAMVGAKSILNERATETLSRLLTTPTSRGQVLVGKFIGTVLSCILQFVLLAAATRLFFGIDWGGNPVQLLALGAMYAVAVSGLSMALAALVQQEQSADIVAGIGIQLLAVLGGSMIPLYVFSETMQKIALLAPNAWALTGLLDIMEGTTWQALFLPLTVLLAVGAASLLFGTWRLRAQ